MKMGELGKILIAVALFSHGSSQEKTAHTPGCMGRRGFQ
jgi:hypothetical protein